MLPCSFINVYLLFQVHKQVGHVRIGYWCVKEWSQPLYEQIYELSMFVLILLLPLSVMSFAYACICKKLWLVASNRANLRAAEGNMPIVWSVSIYKNINATVNIFIFTFSYLFNSIDFDSPGVLVKNKHISQLHSISLLQFLKCLLTECFWTCTNTTRLTHKVC